MSALDRLGVRRGDRLLVHSSLRRVGASSDELAAALLDAVGAAGLLVVPTFTYRTGVYDPRSTPGRTGALAEHLRARPDAVRSLHPTHSVAAVGAGARELCAGHELNDATDVDTPLDRLAASGGWVLLLGVGHVASTTIHVGEFHANAPYLDIPFAPDWPRRHELVVAGERGRTLEYGRFPGCSRAFGAVERGLRKRAAVRDGRVGRADAQLVRGSALIDETASLLASEPAALLCSDPVCYRCSRARRRISGGDPRGRGAGADPAR